MRASIEEKVRAPFNVPALLPLRVSPVGLLPLTVSVPLPLRGPLRRRFELVEAALLISVRPLPPPRSRSRATRPPTERRGEAHSSGGRGGLPRRK